MERGSNGRIIPLLGAILAEAFMCGLSEVFEDRPRNCSSTLSTRNNKKNIIRLGTKDKVTYPFYKHKGRMQVK